MLTLAMVATQAWEQLNDPDYCSQLDMEGFRSLLLRAGYTPKIAHKEAMQRGWDRLLAGVKM